MTTYRDELRPWAIYQYTPDGENVCVCQFRTRSDAYAYMSILRRGGGKYEVVFDKQPQEVQG